MDRRRLWLVAAVIVAGLWSWTQYRQAATVPTAPTTQAPARSSGEPQRTGETAASASPSAAVARDRYPDFLPPQAHTVLDAVARGGPYAYRQDDGVFQNRERRLPTQSRGYYREYTVPTPGSNDRGARRIVIGGDPPAAYYYTDDHYGSFRQFEVAR